MANESTTSQPNGQQAGTTGAPPAPDAGETKTATAAAPPAAPAAPPCPACGAPRVAGQGYCGDCGMVFADGAAAGTSTAAKPLAPATPVKGRYELGKVLCECGDIVRYQGKDLGSASPVAVVIVRAPASATGGDAHPAGAAATGTAEEPVDAEIVPGFEEPVAVATVDDPNAPAWPSIAWERALLEKAKHPALPTVLDSFTEDGCEYLIEEVPVGQSLWDAWDDPASTNEKRWPWLVHVAEGLQQLHKAGAILESIRPDVVIVTPEGQARLTDLTELLPLPLPPNPPLRASMYTAPELILNIEKADARANLYSFGAMVYSLFMGRELTEVDFDKQQGQPKPFIPRFPDAHPIFGRLIAKTFIRELDFRFPTDEAMKVEATGFAELIKTLETCKRTLDEVHFEIAAWTTIGMIRTGNEDAYAVLHAAESRQDDMGESALALLCDGMGGYEAGEIASALAIQTLRKLLLQHKMFATLTGDSPTNQAPFDLELCKKLIYDALKEANRTVFEAPKSGIGKRGMGCTAEVVYLNGRNLVVGHVGDSRTYHLSQGNIRQVTRDQTLVNRLIELGQITPEEAEHHPRRSELQQAIGGRATVEPALYHTPVKAGDWVLVCSDGLINHVKDDELRQMLAMEATSAEIAARRLVNFVNIRGATDNTTVVVVRCT